MEIVAIVKSHHPISLFNAGSLNLVLKRRHIIHMLKLLSPTFSDKYFSRFQLIVAKLDCSVHWVSKVRSAKQFSFRISHFVGGLFSFDKISYFTCRLYFVTLFMFFELMIVTTKIHNSCVKNRIS